jgi:hypothetical protein
MTRCNDFRWYRIYHVEATCLESCGEMHEFASDGEAIEFARLLLNEQAIEVWEGERLVIAFLPAFNSGDNQSRPHLSPCF